ncbi:heme-binding protein [Modestobacter versicolor]|uniref:heme-binding protein n=1 Tax=Modestobacter versicolor TaxID=429133 RepID=UPI0034DF3E54
MTQGTGQERATAAAVAALQHARTIGVRVSVALVDLAGHELVVVRDDGAPGFTAGIARRKAATAAAFNRPSAELRDVQERRPEVLEVAGEQLRFRPTTLGGGLPWLLDGQVVGGVGVSGATPEQDTECAEAALAALAG